MVEVKRRCSTPKQINLKKAMFHYLPSGNLQTVARQAEDRVIEFFFLHLTTHDLPTLHASVGLRTLVPLQCAWAATFCRLPLYSRLMVDSCHFRALDVCIHHSRAGQQGLLLSTYTQGMVGKLKAVRKWLHKSKQSTQRQELLATASVR